MVLSTVHEETAVWQIEGNLEGESLSVSYATTIPPPASQFRP